MTSNSNLDGISQPRTLLQRFLYDTYLYTFGPNTERTEENLGLPLEKHLNSFHSRMIAIGGAIGTGFLIGSGEALARAGPLALLGAFAYVGITAYFTVNSLAELAAFYPVAGSFVAYASRFIDQAWGATMGWNYAIQWLVVLPLELVAASITLQYWGSPISPAVWVAIFLFLILAINLFGVRGYGNFEAFFSVIKIAFIVGFLILGVFIDVGIGWNGAAIGASHWYNPGTARHGALGFCSVMVIAAVAYSGTELVGLTSAEMERPRIQLPRAVKSVFLRITLFYLGGTLMIGLLVPFNGPRLVGQENSLLAISESPFVIAIANAKIQALPSIVNAVILMTVLSVANSSVYGSTRTISSMAFNGQAPSCFAYIDTQGRPMIAFALALAFGCLAFLAELSSKDSAFTWLLSISGTSVIITWGSLCGAHIQFRRAWTAQQKDFEELPFRSPFGIIGSIIGLVMSLSILLMQLIVAIKPVSDGPLTTSSSRASMFFRSYMTVPLVILFYLIYKTWKGTVAKNPLMTVAQHRRFCEICFPDTELRNIENGGNYNNIQNGDSSLIQRCVFIDLTPPPEGSIDDDTGSPNDPMEDDAEDRLAYRFNKFEEWCRKTYRNFRSKISTPWM